MGKKKINHHNFNLKESYKMSYSSQESYLENCEMCDYDVKRSLRNEALVCHVDGSCKRNGRHDAAGGFGCIIKSRKNHYPKLTKKLCCELKPYLGRGIDNISNQSAELMAVYKALCVADYNGYGRNNVIAIHTDSKYVMIVCSGIAIVGKGTGLKLLRRRTLNIKSLLENCTNFM